MGRNLTVRTLVRQAVAAEAWNGVGRGGGGGGSGQDNSRGGAGSSGGGSGNSFTTTVARKLGTPTQAVVVAGGAMYAFTPPNRPAAWRIRCCSFLNTKEGLGLQEEQLHLYRVTPTTLLIVQGRLHPHESFCKS